MNQGTRKALHDCDKFYRQSQGRPESSGEQAVWDRKITVTMRGPRFVAMRATETSFCGGAYPLNTHAAVVFDMMTGELVEWGKFFAAANGASAESDTTDDGATSPEISLHAFTTLALGRAEDPECKRALGDSGELVFQVWPDARRGQLMIQANGQHHVTQGCEETIGLPIAEARKLGVSEEVLDALSQAHRIETPKR